MYSEELEGRYCTVVTDFCGSEFSLCLTKEHSCLMTAYDRDTRKQRMPYTAF